MIFEGEWKANKIVSFFTLQHMPSMLLAIILITVGGAIAKRRNKIPSRHMIIAIFNILALILILTNIPWPYKNVGAALY
jgi:cytochrome bd-type quinol oxidase subunit 1